jgi:hypothetical protein
MFPKIKNIFWYTFFHLTTKNFLTLQPTNFPTDQDDFTMSDNEYCPCGCDYTGNDCDVPWYSGRRINRVGGRVNIAAGDKYTHNVPNSGRRWIDFRQGVGAPQENPRGDGLQGLSNLERRWCAIGPDVPEPQRLPQNPLGHDGHGSDGQPTASRTAGQAKRPRESSPEDQDHGAQRTKSSKFERRFNYLYRPDPTLPDARVTFGKLRAKLVSELMVGGREVGYLRWLLSDSFTPRPSNAELIRAAQAHVKAFDQFMNSLEPDVTVEMH